MKNLKSILLVCLAAVLFSCNDTNEKTDGTLTGNLQGKWKLVNVTGSFAGINDNFTPGVITWNFNPDNNTVTIVNNNTDVDKQDILESGNYVFGINNPSEICTEALLVDSIDWGCLSISTNEMIVNQNFADGMTLKFVR